MFSGPRRLYSKRNSLLNSLLSSLLLLCAWLMLPVTSSAEIATLDEFKALGEKFDHLTTGFALTGEHARLDCGECHIGGVFEALPRECDNCHDDVIAAGKHSTHIQTSQPCDVCHGTGSFLGSAIMDHSTISGNCVTCHDGVSATGKPPTHIASSNICDACHTVNSWTSGLSVDHDHVLGNCSGCHNNVVAVGKSPTHIATTDICEACHQPTGDPSWPYYIVDHGHVIGTCSSCHLTDLPAGHIPIQTECNACHGVAPTPWSDMAVFDHAVVQGLACATVGCHANDKTVDHPTTTNLCDACHQAGVSWVITSPQAVDHGQVIGTCSSCHLTDMPADHIPINQECNACHQVPPRVWTDVIAP